MSVEPLLRSVAPGSPASSPEGDDGAAYEPRPKAPLLAHLIGVGACVCGALACATTAASLVWNIVDVFRLDVSGSSDDDVLSRYCAAAFFTRVLPLVFVNALQLPSMSLAWAHSGTLLQLRVALGFLLLWLLLQAGWQVVWIVVVVHLDLPFLYPPGFVILAIMSVFAALGLKYSRDVFAESIWLRDGKGKFDFNLIAIVVQLLQVYIGLFIPRFVRLITFYDTCASDTPVPNVDDLSIFSTTTFWFVQFLTYKWKQHKAAQATTALELIFHFSKCELGMLSWYLVCYTIFIVTYSVELSEIRTLHDLYTLPLFVAWYVVSGIIIVQLCAATVLREKYPTLMRLTLSD